MQSQQKEPPMAVAELVAGDLSRRLMSSLKASEARGDPPLVQAMEAARCARDLGSSAPYLDLGFVIVSNLCFDHNTPSLWKLLYQTMESRVVSPLHTLALLTVRIIPKRKQEPEAYRLYLELLRRYLLADDAAEFGAHRDEITKSVDGALQLSHTYGIQKIDYEHLLIFFLLSAMMGLLDGILQDWGLQVESIDKQSRYPDEVHQVMDADGNKYSDDMINKHREQLLEVNSFRTLEVLEKITANRKAKAFLGLIHVNKPEEFNNLMQRLRLIEDHRSTSQCFVSARHILVKLSANTQEIITGPYKLNKHHLPGILLDAPTCDAFSCYSNGAGRASCWISLDVYMENAMDWKNPQSAIEVFTELTKSLQAINRASWHETFQALWISALRLLQRDHVPWEGPVPRLELRICMLLSIVPLAIVPLVKQEGETSAYSDADGHGMEQNKICTRRQELILSLQVLGQFSGLLSPPPAVVNVANDAASKAATFISNFKAGGGNLSPVSNSHTSVRAVGNMLHLIVEACIARNLIDTSAYFWPGYVISSSQSKNSTLVQESPWSKFMGGAQLTDSLRKSLTATPASSVMELEKLYHIALNGCDEEQPAAAKILCGASLKCGWNIQEHVVRMVMKLLSPPVLPGFPGNGIGNHLTGDMSLLSALLFAVYTIDNLQILSLYGMVPELAAALLPLCEAFGSIPSPPSHKSSPTDEKSTYAVFSCAFLFLLRLWKFYKPSQENRIAARGGPVNLEFSLDYLLRMRNRRIALQISSAKDELIGQPIYIDSFPKLRSWYLQNEGCLASTVSSLCSKSPANQVAIKILNMICWKMKIGGNNTGDRSVSSSGSIGGSPLNTEENSYQMPTLSAWEVLDAIPYVLEAVLSGCAHGRLSSRDLIKALRDLVDFLPASFATITTYLSAEITRGIWKPVYMNGIDWPSPAANVKFIESEVKEILASAGVHVPGCYASGMDPMLPLPMAALVSLSITFKVEKSLHYMNAIVGQALENCITRYPWSSMPIISALWTQKVCTFHDYIIFVCTCQTFTYDQDTITQLIQSCFSSFLNSNHCSLNALLGNGSCLPVAPGFLYLHTCRMFQETRFASGVVLRLVIDHAKKLTDDLRSNDKNTSLKSRNASLGTAVARVQDAAKLGATLLFITGELRLVKILYEETLPEFLILSKEEEVGPTSWLIGYAMAYMLILSGAFVWGVGDTLPAFALVCSTRADRGFVMHLDFVVRVMDGDMALGCGPALWKAYLLCFIGLLVRVVPVWVSKVKIETLKKLANGLKRCGECGLALQLLELGGPEAVTAAVESVF